jgi:hypothetical protein
VADAITVEIPGLRLVSEANAHEHFRVRQKRAKEQNELVTLVMRTRAPGKDFQEWIQYDIEYVEKRGPLLDLRIFAMTVMNLLRIGRRGEAGSEAPAAKSPKSASDPTDNQARQGNQL